MTAANPGRPTLVLSRLDCDRLDALLEQPANAGPQFDALREELARAEVREPQDMPPDAITMNSIARFRDEATGEERELTLVYPRDADGSADKVSILAPVGTASRNGSSNRNSTCSVSSCSGSASRAASSRPS